MQPSVITRLLDLGRWAPSGDNTQPWRFEIVDATHFAIHGYDTRSGVLYDFDGHASQMAHGALLETIRLGATQYDFTLEWAIRQQQDDSHPIYDLTLVPAKTAIDPLATVVRERCVQRRAMSTQPLTASQRMALQNAVGPDYLLQFFDTRPQKMAIASLLWNNAHLRLTCQEAYPVHRAVIEWNSQFSKDRIPDQAVGVDPLTRHIMRWVMKSWPRVEFFNRFLLGTILPRIELDFVPAIACASHMLLRPKQNPITLQDWITAGMAMQRLWLTATHLGLHLQPEMTPVIFRWYVSAGRPISRNPAINDGARKISTQFEAIANATSDDAFSFFCRVGRSRTPKSRSLRKDLTDLMIDKPQG